MKKCFQFGFIILLFTACSTRPETINPDNANNMYKLIDNNQLKEIEERLKDKNNLDDLESYFLVNHAIQNCNAEVVKLILDKKVVAFGGEIIREYRILWGQPTGHEKILLPGAILVNRAIQNKCDKVLALFSDKIDPDNFVIGVNGSGCRDNSFEEACHYVLDSLYDNDYKPILKVVLNRLRSDCSNQNQYSCNLRDRLEGNIKENAFNNSPDGILQAACREYYSKIDTLKLIQEYKEQSKVSGYIYTNPLYGLGVSASEAEKEFKKLNKQYLAKTKHNINPGKQCKREVSSEEYVSEVPQPDENSYTEQELLQNACDKYIEMTTNLERVKELKSRSKYSGLLDYGTIDAIKAFGDTAYNSKQYFQRLNKIYKIKTKHNINPKKQCKKAE